MLGTKALLESQKPPPPVKPVVKTVCKIKLPDWDLDEVARVFGIERILAGTHVSDARLVNFNVSLWLGSHGFIRGKDGASGFLLTSRLTGACWRLRIACKRLDLPPSVNRGDGRTHKASRMEKEQKRIDGFAVAFTAEMPGGPAYFLSNRFVQFLTLQGLLSDKQSGDSAPVREFLLAAFKTADTLREVVRETNTTLAKALAAHQIKAIL